MADLMMQDVVRGPSVTPGYFEDDAANDGSLYSVDRKKDMIKTGRENVSSVEVEEALARHSAAHEVAVFGLPDAYWIEKVVAAVVALPGARMTPEQLEPLATKIAGFEVPKEVYVVPDLPKNPTGKVLKRELRKSYDRSAGATG